MPTPTSTARKKSSRASTNRSRWRPPAAAPGSIGARLDTALAESDLTQTDLARLLAGPLAEPTRIASVRRLIAKWRRGDHAPTLDYALHLAQIFGKDTGYFAAEDGEKLDVSERSSRSVAEIEAIEFVRQAAACVNEANGANGPLPRTKADIARQVPQFNSARILIDRVVELVPGERILARKKFSEQDWGLGWWYKGTALVPAVLLIEALTQAGALVLLTQPENKGRIALSAGFNNVRFRRVVMSGEELELHCAITAIHGQIAHARVAAKTGSDIAVRGELVLAIN